MNVKKTIVAVAVALAIPATSQADSITFSATSGNLAASATFDVVGDNLLVTLSNTSPFDVLAPPDVLTAVFFDISGIVNLTPESAFLASDSIVLFGPGSADGNVGGEWAYEGGLSGAPGGASHGISSSGLGLFGSANFNGPNLDGPSAVNGVNYGITSFLDDASGGNMAVTGQFPLIWYSVVFTLSGVGSGFNPATSISNVSFQYGTQLSEPNISAPDGGMTLTLLGLALAGMGFVSRRRR